jgi:hypothetical protein
MNETDVDIGYLRWKNAAVYFLLNYLETPHRDFDNAFIPLINFKDNLQKGSGTDVELFFSG